MPQPFLLATTLVTALVTSIFIIVIALVSLVQTAPAIVITIIFGSIPSAHKGKAILMYEYDDLSSFSFEIRFTFARSTCLIPRGGNIVDSIANI